MFKSRAITISLRFYVSFAIAALLGAYVVGVTSQHSSIIDQALGPIDAGWKGGVGNHLAYGLLLGVALVAVAVGTMLTAFRDTDPTAQAEAASLEVVPLTRAPSGANYWPAIAAFSLATVVLGLAISSRWLALSAAVVLGGSIVVWTIRAWAERATGDDRANLELYRHIAEPIRLPIGAVLLVAVMIGGFSRVLLTLPSRHSSTAVFGVLGAVILIGCIAIAMRPRISRSAITLVVFVLFLAVITAGIVGAARGPRRFERDEKTTTEQVPRGSGR